MIDLVEQFAIDRAAGKRCYICEESDVDGYIRVWNAPMTEGIAVGVCATCFALPDRESRLEQAVAKREKRAQ